MHTIYSGIVASFGAGDNQGGQGFGFLVADGGKHVFFHCARHCSLRIFQDGLVHFGGPAPMERIPKPGDGIIFIPKLPRNQRKGWGAEVWAFKDHADTLLIRNREAKRSAEVDAKFGSFRHMRMVMMLDAEIPRVLWEGTNINDVASIFPRFGGEHEGGGDDGAFYFHPGSMYIDRWKVENPELADLLEDDEWFFFYNAPSTAWFECRRNGAWVPFPDLRPIVIP